MTKPKAECLSPVCFSERTWEVADRKHLLLNSSIRRSKIQGHDENLQ